MFFVIYHNDNGILWVCEFRTISLEHSSHHVTSRLHSLMRGPGSRYSAYILMLLQLGFTPEFCLQLTNCWFLLLLFHRFLLRRTMGRQQWSLFSRAWKQSLEKYDFLVSLFLPTLLGSCLVFSSGEMAFRYRQHQSQIKQLNTWVSRSSPNCTSSNNSCNSCSMLIMRQWFCFYRCHGHCYSIIHMLNRLCDITVYRLVISV